MFPNEIYAIIAQFDVFTLGKLRCCCRNLRNLDALMAPTGNVVYDGWTYFKSRTVELEYIKYANWYVWIIRRNNTNTPFLKIICRDKNINETHKLATKNPTHDVDGKRRIERDDYNSRMSYVFSCNKVTLRIVFGKLKMIPELAVIYDW
jgi:hypothetical protein